MNENIIVELQHQNGIYLTYKLTHIYKGFTNIYEIDAKISGVNDCKENALFITCYSCKNLTSNKETILDEFAIELIENYLSN